jgi:hypothetical protein
MVIVMIRDANETRHCVASYGVIIVLMNCRIFVLV